MGAQVQGSVQLMVCAPHNAPPPGVQSLHPSALLLPGPTHLRRRPSRGARASTGPPGRQGGGQGTGSPGRQGQTRADKGRQGQYHQVRSSPPGRSAIRKERMHREYQHNELTKSSPRGLHSASLLLDKGQAHACMQANIAKLIESLAWPHVVSAPDDDE